MKKVKELFCIDSLFTVFVWGLVLTMVVFAGMNIIPSVQATDDTEVINEIVSEKEKYTIHEIEMEFIDQYNVIAEEITYTGDASYYNAATTIKPFKWLTDIKIATNYEGKIEVTYDLSQATFQETDGMIVVTLPKAKITTHTCDLVDCTSEESIFSKNIQYTDYENLMNEIKEAELTKAIENGLYIQAQASIEKNITSTINSITNGEVQVTFIYR